MNLCDINDCTGCQACRISCPKSAISMEENSKGHIYPKIDDNLCVGCGRCRQVCPSINPPVISDGPLVCYAAHALDKQVRKYSTSGGLSYVISNKIIELGGAFCGVVWSKNSAIHKVVEDKASLKEFQGSKYVHSDVCDTYLEIKEFLQTGKKVVFTGTPCQCAGLLNYLGRKDDNLLLVDIICHGVPSRKFLRDCIFEEENKYGKNICSVRFRDKYPDQYNSCMKYIFEDGMQDVEKYNESFYYRLFVDNYTLRDNCFHCKYSSIKRVSDITIADFWGYMPYKLRFRDYRKGMSIVLINSIKGKFFFEELTPNISCEKRSYKENLNVNLYRPQTKPDDYDEFWTDYLSGMSLVDIKNKYLQTIPDGKITFRRLMKETLSIILPKPFFEFITKQRK